MESCWEVTVARYGRRTTTRSEVFLNHHLYDEPDGPIGMDYFFWVLRRGAETVVVDTGFSRAGGDRRNRQTLVEVPELLARLGVDPDDRPTVVVTHAHYDHIGNLDLFPRSEVVVARHEVEFWASPLRDAVLFGHSVDDESLAALQKSVSEGRAVQFSGRHEVAPGVSVIEVGGHTPGQSMVLVRTSAGLVLLTSDAVHYYEELDREMPFTSVVDLAGMYRGFDQIRRLVEEEGVAVVVPGHDPDTFERLEPGVQDDAFTVTIGAAS